MLNQPGRPMVVFSKKLNSFSGEAAQHDSPLQTPLVSLINPLQQNYRNVAYVKAKCELLHEVYSYIIYSQTCLTKPLWCKAILWIRRRVTLTGVTVSTQLVLGMRIALSGFLKFVSGKAKAGKTMYYDSGL